jgi:hypothetical protein
MTSLAADVRWPVPLAIIGARRQRVRVVLFDEVRVTRDPTAEPTSIAATKVASRATTCRTPRDNEQCRPSSQPQVSENYVRYRASQGSPTAGSAAVATHRMIAALRRTGPEHSRRTTMGW